MIANEMLAKKPAIESTPVSVDSQPFEWRKRLNTFGFSFWYAHAYWWLPAAATLLIVRYGAGRPVLGWDEIATWDASTRSLSELVALAANIDVVFAPYYLFMHAWIEVFGDSEVALRAPSILTTVAAVALIAVLARRLFSPRVGLITGLLLAIVPGITRYGQEVRPYGFALMFGTLATLLLFRALDRSSWWRWAGYSLTVALLGLFQLMGLLLLLGHAAVVAERIWRVRNWKQAVRDRAALGWLIAAVMGVLPCLPLAYIALGQRSQLNWLPPMQWDSFQNLPNDLFWSPLIGWFILGLTLFAGALDGSAVRRLVFIAVLPVFGLYVAAFFTWLWVPRYVIYTLPIWCLLAAVAVATRRWRIAMVFALIATIGLPVHENLRKSTGHDQADYRVAMRVIDKNYRPGDGIVYERIVAWSVRPAVRYYLPSNRPRDVLAERSPLQMNSIYAEECRNPSLCLSGVPRVWVFLPHTFYSPLSQLSDSTADAIEDQYEVDQIWRLGNATVGLYVRESSA